MQRSVRLTLGTAVALALLGALPAAVFAAQPSCGDTLTSNTTLTADLDCSGANVNALTLGADGITLNLGGHTLTGYAGDDTNVGVYTDFDGTTITNGTIANAGYGVYTSYASSTTVSSLTINAETGAFTDDYGIYMEYGANNKINHVTTTGQYIGVSFYESASNLVKNSTFTADNTAVYTEYETRDTFDHNTTHADYGFYDDYSGGNSYLSNTANGGVDGIYMDCDSYGPVTLIGNTTNNNSGDGVYTSDCYVDPPGAPEPSLIKGNTANYNGGHGFEDSYSVGATWKNNVASHNGDNGFLFDYPGNAHITGNTANHNTNSGIALIDNYGVGYGSPKEISFNTLKHNDYGINASEGVPNGVCHGNTIKLNATKNVKGLVCN